MVLEGPKEFEAISGMGIKATSPDMKQQQQQIFLGNRKLMHNFEVDIEDSVERKMSSLESEGKTVMILAFEKGREREIAGLIAVADTLKESSPAAITALKELNIETIMLTGDNEKTALSKYSSISFLNIKIYQK